MAKYSLVMTPTPGALKMQEWKHRHGPAGVENAGVEVIELQQHDNL